MPRAEDDLQLHGQAQRRQHQGKGGISGAARRQQKPRLGSQAGEVLALRRPDPAHRVGHQQALLDVVFERRAGHGAVGPFLGAVAPADRQHAAGVARKFLAAEPVVEVAQRASPRRLRLGRGRRPHSGSSRSRRRSPALRPRRAQRRRCSSNAGTNGASLHLKSMPCGSTSSASSRRAMQPPFCAAERRPRGSRVETSARATRSPSRRTPRARRCGRRRRCPN